MEVNRQLIDDEMDRIDHALGRPLAPMGETSRNVFATTGEEADEMAASAYWHELPAPAGYSDLRFFRVTLKGRKVLAAYLLAGNGIEVAA